MLHSAPDSTHQRRVHFVAVALWCFLISGCVLRGAQATPQKPIPQTDVATYRAQLQSAEHALNSDAPRAGAVSALQPLTTVQDVKRRDGQVLATDNGEWTRRIQGFSSPPTGQQIAGARQALRARLSALDAWSRQDFVPADSKGADAQSIVRRLEKNGEIRTGPTQWEQFQVSVWKAISDFFQRFSGGTGRAIPTGSAQAAYWILGIVAAASLAFVLWLIARAFLGRTSHGRGRKRGIEAVGDDADLLIYGPDELRSRARRFAAQGNFREALRNLYVALLLDLDVKGVWRYDPRRTNWEHIAQLRNAPRSETQAFAPPMAELTRLFDRVRYGDAPCEEPEWKHFSQDAERVEKQLAAKVGGAA